MILKVNFAALLRPAQQEFALNVLAQVPWVVGEVLRQHWVDIAFNGLMTAVVFTCLNLLTVTYVRRIMNTRHAFLAHEMGGMVAEHMQRHSGRVDVINNRMNGLREDITDLKLRDYENVDAAIADALKDSDLYQRQNTIDKEMAVLCSEHERYTVRAKAIEERHRILERSMAEIQQLAREANREAARCSGAVAQINDLLAKQDKARSKARKVKV